VFTWCAWERGRKGAGKRRTGERGSKAGEGTGGMGEAQSANKLFPRFVNNSWEGFDEIEAKGAKGGRYFGGSYGTARELWEASCSLKV